VFYELHKIRAAQGARHMLDLFTQDPDRATTFSVETGDMRFDYAKTQIDAETRNALIKLCVSARLADRREAMFSGAKINETEGRAVLHTVLRNVDGGPVLVDGQDVIGEVRATLDRMEEFAHKTRTCCPAGDRVTDVVNIGIGGSDLGPMMAVTALSPYHDGPQCHFVSNVDGGHIADTIRNLNPASTLVIVASKTFTTVETMTNARTARAWMVDGGGDPSKQFVALSTAMDKAEAFGIPPEHVFGFADWVGGRYSIWGPIGLSLMLAIGADAFRAFLRGAQAMDIHFRCTDWQENMPVMLALVGIWHHQICGYRTRAVLPYEQRLLHLSAYFQQMEMESNGKRISMDGTDLEIVSGPVVWGEPGTNGQHAFYQLIHQGTAIVPCEFMIGATGHEPDLAHHHRLLVANCLAQSEALLRGRSLDEARERMVAEGFEGAELERQARHRVLPGNRPSTTLSYPLLTPFVLGQIVALYEHRVFVEGVILDINSYDQWGVELGKELATALYPVLDGQAELGDRDGSTAALFEFIKKHGG